MTQYGRTPKAQTANSTMHKQGATKLFKLLKARF